MSKLSLQVGSKDFDINLDEDFYDFFTEDFKKMFKDKKVVEIKELLQAYVQKCYNEHQDKQEIKKLLERIDKL
ncbi:MAG: hypothetical protein GXP61_11045 [Epsilonproteobacteria bacterium]|nr:hypothetical protein [Campylobacterota bacterium]